MATITGARALHLEQQIGSLEVGKKADLIVVDTTAPHATPMYNVYSAFVYALKSSNVRTTVVGGKLSWRIVTCLPSMNRPSGQRLRNTPHRSAPPLGQKKVQPGDKPFASLENQLFVH